MLKPAVLSAAVFLSSSSFAVQINSAVGPLQENTACTTETAEICDLRIYQVMVGAFVDGDPEHDYTDGYGTSHHRGNSKTIDPNGLRET